jgi:hypothetical protein
MIACRASAAFEAASRAKIASAVANAFLETSVCLFTTARLVLRIGAGLFDDVLKDFQYRTMVE